MLHCVQAVVDCSRSGHWSNEALLEHSLGTSPDPPQYRQQSSETVAVQYAASVRNEVNVGFSFVGHSHGTEELLLFFGE
mgnify:CR=1 FL=1